MSDDDCDPVDWSTYESGPFCRHWASPGDCDRACAACGCSCTSHGIGEGETACDQCECRGYVDPDDAP